MLDASVVLAWLLPDELSDYADAAIAAVYREGAMAPGTWPVEVANGLLAADRRGRMDRSTMNEGLRLALNLPLDSDVVPLTEAVTAASILAMVHNLAVYDALYLEAALRLSMGLATADARLRDAGMKAGVTLFLP